MQDVLYICRESSTNRPFFYKTNPIMVGTKLMQTQYLQWIIEKSPPSGGVKTKPIQSQYKPNTNPILAQKQASIMRTNPNKANTNPIFSSIGAHLLPCRGPKISLKTSILEDI